MEKFRFITASTNIHSEVSRAVLNQGVNRLLIIYFRLKAFNIESTLNIEYWESRVSKCDTRLSRVQRVDILLTRYLCHLKKTTLTNKLVPALLLRIKPGFLTNISSKNTT